MQATPSVRPIHVTVLCLCICAVLLAATFARQEAAWEYHFVYGYVSAEAYDRAGAEGWELVSVVHVPRRYAGVSEPRIAGGSWAVNVESVDASTVAVFKRIAR